MVAVAGEKFPSVDMPQAFRALGSQSNLDIVRLLSLSETGMTIGEVAAELDIAYGHAQKALTSLTNSGLVKRVWAGKSSHFEVNRKTLAEIKAYVDPMQHRMWVQEPPTDADTPDWTPTVAPEPAPIKRAFWRTLFGF